MIHENIETVKPEPRRGAGSSVGPDASLPSPSWPRKQRKRRIYLWAALTLCAVIVGAFLLEGLYASYQPKSSQATPGDWTTYMADNGRSGFNAKETIITPSSAPHLKLQWTHTVEGAPSSQTVAAGGPLRAEGSRTSIASQTVAANGLLYWGSWNGFEYATTPSNHLVWSTNLGMTIDQQCGPSPLGVTSTATIATVQIKGAMTSVDFVGGGNGNLYALDAHTGTIIWKTQLGVPPAHYLWSSPAVYHGSIYIGLSSHCDQPLVQGGLAQLDAATGTIQHTFKAVPQGCVGASVWTSPTIDEAAGTIYISTGNGNKCAQPELYRESLVELRLSDLSVLHSWQVPRADRGPDSDFGATPTLFTSSTGLPMVGLANKDSIYYAFKRDNLSKPLWTAKIATIRGSQSSSAWDGHRLYVAGENIILGGIHCNGSIAALNPDTGAFIWQYCLRNGLARGSVTAVPGLVVYAIGKRVLALDAASGQLLFTYRSDTSNFWGWASISNGVLYVGSIDGKLYAFAP